MAFDQTTRNRLQKFVSDARDLLTDEFNRQLQNDFGMDPDSGIVSDTESLSHLNDAQHQIAILLRDTMKHYQASSPGIDLKEIIDRIVREQAFTVLNRICALRMAESRGVLIESVSKGYNSRGFQLYSRVAKTSLGESGDTYRNYLFSVFDEFSNDLAVLFDRYSPMGRLFPKESALLELLDKINDIELESLWAEDETIGWIYQYFNSKEERKKMRAESSAPRNSRELAVRNQFFTPRYVVEFLTDNTLGRIWYEMTKGETVLKDLCRYLVKRPNEIFIEKGEKAPEQIDNDADLSQEELLKQTVYIEHRPIKDPREILMLDPACGSMHFGLYAFDLFEKIYEETWDLQSTGQWQVSDNENLGLLTEIYTTRNEFLQDIPRLIIEKNIHGVDIDPRAVQIAGLSLWLRAQRAWEDQNVKPGNRPQIKKSNIVCAEPMPGEKKFLRTFSERMKPRVLGQLVEIIFEKMKFAGEAGSLLKIEEEIEDAVDHAREEFNKELLRRKEEAGYLPGMAPKNRQHALFDFADLPDKTQFWQTAEEKIMEALRNYAEQVEAEDGSRLRLFVEDVAKGFAFIDLCRKRFDILLMNPPFGEISLNCKKYIISRYPVSNSNLAITFVERALNLSDQKIGKIAYIADKSTIVRNSYEKWRRIIFLKQAVEFIINSGWNVLDANVETYLAVLGKQESNISLLADIADDISKPESLKTNINFKYEIKPRRLFSDAPNAAIQFGLPNDIISLFSSQQLDPSLADVKIGSSPGDSFRFYRYYWEVCSNSKNWLTIWNGGEFSPYFRESYYLINWKDDGSELKNLVDSNGNSLSRPQNLSFLHKPGLSYGKRGNYINPAIMNSNCGFTDEGQIIIPKDPRMNWFILCILNTKLIRFLINTYCGQHKHSGYVRKIPIHNSLINSMDSFSILSRKIYDYLIGLGRSKIEHRLFCGIKLQKKSLNEEIKNAKLSAIDTRKNLREIESEINQKVFSIVGLSKHSESIIEESLSGVPNFDEKYITSPNSFDSLFLTQLFDYIVGIVFGRWDIRFTTGEKLPPELPDPFAPLPVCPPGQLQNVKGLPAHPEDVQTNYPLRISWSGIIVDDKGHSEDIFTRVREVIEIIWKDKASDIEQEACEILGVRDLCEYFAKPGKFFADHLKRYSKSRRQAPIYWPLSTPSASYTLWLYYHRLTDQTLYTCINNFVDGKLKQVADDAERLRKKSNRTSQEEKNLEKLSDLEMELKDFHDELFRIAKFWKPNLNDGVQITAAPLWKLFQQKPWQNKLKQTWKDLEKGKYDWAHLAYSIWPERVIRASHKDRSYAIAHDLEDDLWEKIENGTDRQGNPKTKWVPKKFSEKELEKIIQEIINE